LMKSQLEAKEASALLEALIKGELPDERGRFGPFGGRYVPETLVPAFERLEAGVREYLHDADF
jgi:tryptophan synthase beta chain